MSMIAMLIPALSLIQGVTSPAGVPLALAFGAGVLSTLNPCGFALLPAYVSYTVGQRTGGRQETGWEHILRGGLLFQLFPPLLAVIGRQFQVNHSSASLVMTLFLAPILLIAFPAGALVSRYGVRLMGQLAFGWLIAGTSVCIAAPTFAVLLLGRVISGVGGGLLVIALLTLITENIPKAERGLAWPSISWPR